MEDSVELKGYCRSVGVIPCNRIHFHGHIDIKEDNTFQGRLFWPSLSTLYMLAQGLFEEKGGKDNVLLATYHKTLHPHGHTNLQNASQLYVVSKPANGSFEGVYGGRYYQIPFDIAYSPNLDNILNRVDEIIEWSSNDEAGITIGPDEEE